MSILAAQTNGLCILVVEDHENVRSLIVSHLRDQDYVVLEASSGEEALAILHTPNRPAIGIVFTDIHLGGQVTGWEVAEAFRSAHPESHVIYTSGQVQNRARQVPKSTFLAKPYLPSDIVELIEAQAA